LLDEEGSGEDVAGCFDSLLQNAFAEVEGWVRGRVLEERLVQ